MKVIEERSCLNYIHVSYLVVNIGGEEIYEDVGEPAACSSPKPIKASGAILNVPAHSLTAFGLFLRLPNYAEVLLKDMKKALCLLRLILGVTDDGEGNWIRTDTLCVLLHSKI